MKKFVVTAALGAAMVFSGSAVSAQQGQITKLLRSTVPVFDASGAEVKRVKKNDVSTPLEVSDFNELGYLEVTLDGRKVYLRRADVLYNGPATCKLSAESQRTSRGNAAGTPGMRAGAGSSGKACVPVKKP